MTYLDFKMNSIQLNIHSAIVILDLKIVHKVMLIIQMLHIARQSQFLKKYIYLQTKANDKS